MEEVKKGPLTLATASDALPHEIFLKNLLVPYFSAEHPTADLAYFATYCNDYLFICGSVLFSPSNPNHLYAYGVIDQTRKDFLINLITQPNFNPENIRLDDYRSIGIAPTSEEGEPSSIFNPLLFLHLNGNVKLLKRIYDHAVKEINELTEITVTSHEPFNYNLGLSVFSDYVHEFNATPTKKLAIMTQYVNALWAICTYQSPQEFDRHYAGLLLPMIRQCHQDAFFVQEKLIDYAVGMQNVSMLNRLCLQSSGELLKRNAYPIRQLINAGLDIMGALRTGDKDIASGVIYFCTNPVDLQGEMDHETRKKIVLALLDEYIVDFPKHLKAHRLKTAVENNRGMDFFDDPKSNPPPKTFFFAHENNFLINLFHFAKPLFSGFQKSLRKTAAFDEIPVLGDPRKVQLPMRRNYV